MGNTKTKSHTKVEEHVRNGANDGSEDSARQRRVYLDEVLLHVRLAAAAEQEGAKFGTE